MPYKDPAKQRQYAKKHYRDNKQYYLNRNRINRKKLKSFVHQIKESTPCTDCGVSYPYYVMEFDHLENKQGIIIEFIRRHNKQALKDEIAKCEVVCSNCHRIRTHQRATKKNGV